MAQVTQRRGEAAALLEVCDLSLAFQNDNGPFWVLDGLRFQVPEGAFVAVLGPSGCGKSTLLRVLAGLLPPTQGEVRVDGTPLTGPRPDIGLVFQEANLLPWRSVLENIALPLLLRGIPKNEAHKQARAMVRLIGLEGFEHTLPKDLSGGMAQRVALARALVYKPRLLLLDEPFASLDALTREQMWEEMLRLWHHTRVTVVMVTHSITEALFLADRLYVLSPRPAQVRLTLDVPFPRPREEYIRYTRAFGQLAQTVRRAIAGENFTASTAP